MRIHFRVFVVGRDKLTQMFSCEWNDLCRGRKHARSSDAPNCFPPKAGELKCPRIRSLPVKKKIATRMQDCFWFNGDCHTFGLAWPPGEVDPEGFLAIMGRLECLAPPASDSTKDAGLSMICLRPAFLVTKK